MNIVNIKENMQSDIEQGRELLINEAEALQALANDLGASFSGAVDIMFNTNGRVIITGMGKSGHIGAKIAATLASTGTPSFFVHPGEASHGDLGMVTVDDVVIAISHSGETKELGDFIAHCSRFSIPLIAITRKIESTLGRSATVTLCDGVSKEACPMGLAPTTSTTAALALGDALAVVLIQRRGFKAEDFAKYHPGGKLGSKLISVKELMASGEDMPVVFEDTLMDKAMLMMSKKRLGAVGVVDKNGGLAGIITDGDLRRNMSTDIMTKSVTDIMTVNPMVIEQDDLAAKAVSFMQEKEITCLFVVEAEGSDQLVGAKPVGVVHIHDCLKAGII